MTIIANTSSVNVLRRNYVDEPECTWPPVPGPSTGPYPTGPVQPLAPPLATCPGLEVPYTLVPSLPWGCKCLHALDQDSIAYPLEQIPLILLTRTRLPETGSQTKNLWPRQTRAAGGATRPLLARARPEPRKISPQSTHRTLATRVSEHPLDQLDRSLTLCDSIGVPTTLYAGGIRRRLEPANSEQNCFFSLKDIPLITISQCAGFPVTNPPTQVAPSSEPQRSVRSAGEKGKGVENGGGRRKRTPRKDLPPGVNWPNTRDRFCAEMAKICLNQPTGDVTDPETAYACFIHFVTDDLHLSVSSFFLLRS